MTKRVVFAGGVQAKALAKAYRLDVALDYDEDVFFIGAESMAREAAQRVVKAADILVTDLTPDGPTVKDELIQVGTLRIAVPVVTADFIWPFSGGAHPRNMYASGLPEGPYPTDFGDRYLDDLAREGLDEDEAIARYLALDIAEEARLDEMLRDRLVELERLDAETGFDLADFVSGTFRTQNLFATRNRLNLPLFKHMAARLFSQMGIAVSRISMLSDTYFLPGAMPIHPGVLAYFGMEAPAPEHKYPMLDEGYFSFEQYCRRYWRYEFNRLLHAGIAKADSNPSEAIPELRVALEQSPESRSGLRALKDAERAVSDASMLPPLVLAAPAPVAAPPPAAPLPQAPEIPKAAAEMPATLPQALESEAPAADSAPSSIRLPEALRSAPEPVVSRPAFGSALLARPLDALPLDMVPGSGAPTIDQDGIADAQAPLVSQPSAAFGAWPLPAAAALAPEQDEGTQVPLTLFTEPPQHLTTLVQVPVEVEPEPEPQSYVELPLTQFGDPPLASPANLPVARGNRYTPLAPADHLIPMLPRMLPNTRGMAGAIDRPFAAMPETMPPPPLRPVLPPELHPEPVKTSLVARIMDQLRK